MRAIEYECHPNSDVMIKLCPKVGACAEYWFLYRHGRECYWGGLQWQRREPKQFPNAYAAFQEWQQKIDDPLPKARCGRCKIYGDPANIVDLGFTTTFSRYRIASRHHETGLDDLDAETLERKGITDIEWFEG